MQRPFDKCEATFVPLIAMDMPATSGLSFPL